MQDSTRAVSGDHYDLLVVGGGINGVGIAADAAGRGLKVCVVEKNDLASATSSWSSKLIHGGLRYLEHYEFRLVREALAEREVLLRKAPHLIKPLRFILPHRPHLRAQWLVRCGLFLYNHIGGASSLPHSNYLKFDHTSVLQPGITRGFDYYDCAVDDSRLVIVNAQSAQKNGAVIQNYTECVHAKRENNQWSATLQSTDGHSRQVFATGLVNAAGPWAQQFIESKMQARSPRRVRLIKGSHIIVKQLYSGDHAYILQNEDKRIVFVIPYHRHFSLVGTTDREYQGDPKDAAIDQYEKEYLIRVVNDHFKRGLNLEDILFDYSGVRPLCDDESTDPSVITRDYTLESEDLKGQAPLLSVFGGKITTYRKLAEAALKRLKPYFPQMGPSWTARTPLPGGELSARELKDRLIDEAPWLPLQLAERYMNTYGNQCFGFLNACNGLQDLGRPIIPELHEAELAYLKSHEWAKTAEDVLWRRTKLGLWRTPEETERLNRVL